MFNSMNMYGISGYNPMESCGMYNSFGSTVNVHQNFKQKYSIVPEDTYTSSYKQCYPVAINKEPPKPFSDRFALIRFLKKLYN